MGKDLLYLISSSGNELGAKWLQSVLGDEYKVHTTKDIYDLAILTHCYVLKPGLVLLNDIELMKKHVLKFSKIGINYIFLMLLLPLSRS